MFENILIAVFSFFVLLILISLGGRLLGLRITFLRGLLIALLGLVAGIGLAALGATGKRSKLGPLFCWLLSLSAPHHHGLYGSGGTPGQAGVAHPPAKSTDATTSPLAHTPALVRTDA